MLKRALNGFSFLYYLCIACAINQSKRVPILAQAQISAIGPQQQTILSTRCMQTIWLTHWTRDQVIDKDTDVGFVSPKHKPVLAAHMQGGIDTCHDPLSRRLFVSRRTVDLASQKQA